MSDRVEIVHAEAGGEASVTEQQYRTVFHDRGWRLADGSDTGPAADESAADEQPVDEPTSQPETGRAKPRSKPRSA